MKDRRIPEPGFSIITEIIALSFRRAGVQGGLPWKRLDAR
jgi:hypothetical protein